MNRGQRLVNRLTCWTCSCGGVDAAFFRGLALLIALGEVLVFLSPRSQSIATTPLHWSESLTCCSSSLRACHSWPISFWRSPTFMCLKSPLAWRLTENCTNALAARLTWRSSLMAGHFFECFGSKVRRSLARAAFAILISLTSCDSTQRLYSASAASLDVWTR